MDTVVASRSFDGNLDALVAYCRTLNSRMNWPGAVLEWEQRGTLYYTVGMRLKAATMTDVQVEEKLFDVERADTGVVRFETFQRCTWPHGHADARCNYLFVPGANGAPNTLQLAYTYDTPSGGLIKARELPAFHEAMQRVADAYLAKLTSGVFVGI
jgi:hypothetical protein